LGRQYCRPPSEPNCFTCSASETQKATILPQLAEGEAIIGTAITEPDAGSDVTMAVTTAVKDGDAWVVNGSKMFATNGTLATYMNVFCLTDPENPSRHKRHSFILIPTATPGYQAVKIHGKLGIRASDTAELVFKDLRVPAENLVGVEGEGFSQLMAFFNHTRLHVCAQAVGLSRAALEEAVRHVKGRVQFGQPLAAFQSTQFKIAEMATRIRASRNLYYEAAWSADRGKLDPCPGGHGQMVLRENPPFTAPTKPCRCTEATGTSTNTRSSASTVTPRSLRSMKAPRRSKRPSSRAPSWLIMEKSPSGPYQPNPDRRNPAMEILKFGDGYCEARVPRERKYDGVFESFHGGLLMTIAEQHGVLCDSDPHRAGHPPDHH